MTHYLPSRAPPTLKNSPKLSRQPRSYGLRYFRPRDSATLRYQPAQVSRFSTFGPAGELP